MYKFEHNRKKVKFCPCGRSNRNGKFAPYKGYSKYGYCHSCNRTFNPENKNSEHIGLPKLEYSKKAETSYIDNTVFEKRLSTRGLNRFYKFLTYKFGEEKANQVFETHKIGTSSRWPGATIFWQIDDHNKIRSGRIMLYNSTTGKRIKNCNDWVHSVLIRKHFLSNFNLEQCLFGLHQINKYNTTKIIAIVESEKTACIMGIFLPNYIWLACGGVSSLNYQKIKPLKKHKIILFPDLDKNHENNPFQVWTRKALEFNKLGANVHVSNLLEQKATKEQMEAKLDIADFFL